MKTLITGFLQASEAELEILRDLGLELTVHPDETAPVENPGQYEAVIGNFLFLHNDIRQFTNLRYIQLASAGYDRVDMTYIQEQNIEIHNVAGIFSAPMAEWTVMRILELYRNPMQLHAYQAAGRWEKDRSWQSLPGKKICIVGFGAYGRETAKRLKAFDAEIITVNRTPKVSPFIDAYFPLEQLDTVLADADVVILAVGLADNTRHIMDAGRFAKMKPGAIFINAARGGLVDESALLEALNTGTLSGAALDVFETEPLPKDSPFWTHPRVLVSSHNSFLSEKYHQQVMDVVINNLKERNDG